MTFITSDQIRDISIKTVEGFLNSKIPLSIGLAKEASMMQLNSEQIQRAVEAVNSIAYLKVLSLAEDRTVEFPLCKYAEVIGGVSLPEMDKVAKYLKPTSAANESSMVKAASTEVESEQELTKGEETIHLLKLAAINKTELNNLRDREVTIIPELNKIARIVAKDPQGLEKLATVIDGKSFALATVLVYGEVKPFADTGMFKTAELVDVTKLSSLLKEAQDVVIKLHEKQELADKSELVKQAFLGSIGSAIGRAAGSILGAPVKAVGAAAGRSASNVGNSAMNAARGVVGKPAISTTVKRFGLGAGLVGAANVALDASLYSPGKDQSTGRSKDVWTTLQREPK